MIHDLHEFEKISLFYSNLGVKRLSKFDIGPKWSSCIKSRWIKPTWHYSVLPFGAISKEGEKTLMLSFFEKGTTLKLICNLPHATRKLFLWLQFWKKIGSSSIIKLKDHAPIVQLYNTLNTHLTHLKVPFWVFIKIGLWPKHLKRNSTSWCKR